MKTARWVALSLMIISTAVVTGCVVPIYDTARAQKGLTVGGGLAYHEAYHEAEFDVKFSGIRPDVAVGYGFTNWFSVVGRGGLLFDLEDPDSPIPSIGAGVKFSTPWDRFNLGIRAEFDLPRLYFSATPMMGLSNKKGRELLTVGLQTVLYMPATFFVNIHPLPGTHVFAGAVWLEEGVIPEACIGLGYTYTFDFSRIRREGCQRNQG